MGAQCIPAASTHATGHKAGTLTEPGAVTRTGLKGSLKMDQSKPVEATPRTPEVMMAEVRYGIVFGEMNEVFNGRLNRLLVFISIAAAAVSAANVVQLVQKVDPGAAPTWILICTIIAVVSEAARRAFKLHEREKQFHDAKAAFQELEGKGWSMAQGTLQRELAKLLKSAPAGGSWLAAIAYNKACREIGRGDVQMDVPPPIRLIASLAA